VIGENEFSCFPFLTSLYSNNQQQETIMDYEFETITHKSGQKTTYTNITCLCGHNERIIVGGKTDQTRTRQAYQSSGFLCPSCWREELLEAVRRNRHQ
jgi:hypothetical protein